ncbi:MAG: FAD-binding oxidoreductase [Kiloniellales bacterium]
MAGVREFDFIVIGAGIAGASAGYELAAQGRGEGRGQGQGHNGYRVALLEREDQPGYHTTGRSAALYIQSYGNQTVRALTVSSWQFYTEPPAGFAERPLLSPRGVLFVGRPDQVAALDRLVAETRPLAPHIRRLDAAAARALVPILRADALGGAVLDSKAMEIDVNGLHQGYLRGLKARGGAVVTRAEVRGLQSGPPNGLAGGLGGWLVETKAGNFAAPVVVNAAGAWCDEIARLAGAQPIGLVPKRRTAITFDGPVGLDASAWPLTVGVAEDFYFKPDSGRLMGSPADETPMPPCDVQPDELDIAVAVERIQAATTLEIRRIGNSWAGLRTFAADKTPVAGFDPERAGFFWLAGQGGFGIQTAPAMGRLTAALATGGRLPEDLAALGVTAEAVSPARFA